MDKYLDTITPTDIQALYQRDDGPSIVVGHVRHVLSEFSADPGTDEGRKAIKSMARKIASLKARCERERKAMTSTMRAELDRVYARGRLLCEALDTIRDDVRHPVTEFEQHMERAKREWVEANVKPSAPEPVDTGVTNDRIREAILEDIVRLSAEQIVDKIMAGDVRYVRVVV